MTETHASLDQECLEAAARDKPARPRDLLYDAWVETWGEPVTATERGRLNKALKELREMCAFFKLLGSYPIDVH